MNVKIIGLNGRLSLALNIVVVMTAAIGCLAVERASAEPPHSKQWTLEKVRVLEGFNTPECVCIDPATGQGYVSNIVCPKMVQEKVNSEDGKGFITRLAPGGTIDELRWVESTEAAPLNSIKGLCILDGILYGADLTRVVRYEIKTGKPLAPIPIEAARMLNDMGTDGKHVYASDTVASKIFRLRDGRIDKIAAPEKVNGITFANGKMYAVNVAEHDIYELDPDGSAKPRPFGLAKHFKAIDGIEVLGDGSFLLSDVWGHKVIWVGADQKTVRVLAEPRWAADIGLDRRRNLLYVPMFWDSQVVVFKLKPPGRIGAEDDR